MVLHHFVAQMGEIECRLAFRDRHGSKASRMVSGGIDRRQRLLHCAKMRGSPSG
jgi:hypothetical protein